MNLQLISIIGATTMHARALAALLSTSLILACGGSEEPKPTPTPELTTVHVVGTFLLKQSAPTNIGPPSVSPTATPTCKGRGGYNDIAAGMEVVLSADGSTLSVGRFSPGKVVSLTQFQEQCQFSFELDVPEGHDFYNVKVGRRGDRNYTFPEITSGGALEFTIGP